MSDIPKPILEKAVKINGAMKRAYLALYRACEPVTPDEIARKLGHERAYIHMRLNQLELMGYVKRTREGRNVKFQVII